ncbi:MAG: hypothetical protein ACREC5_03260 [Thermoplasmata archaeon]
MRTGLVAVGIAFLVVGGTALAALYTAPPAPARNSYVSSTDFTVGGSDPSWSAPIWGQNGSGESFSLRWHSTVPVEITLQVEGNLSSCPNGTPCANATSTVRHWEAGESGNWSSAGDPDCPYSVEARSASGATGTVSIVASSSASSPTPRGVVEMWAGAAAALLVLAVGVVATFLGVFLRGGPFRPRGPSPPPASDRAGGPGDLNGP